MKKLFPVVLVVLALSLVTGCSSGAKVVPTPTPTVTASSVVLTCLPSQLKVVLGQEGGAAGSVGVTGIAFENIGTKPCSLSGYPTLRMLNSAGSSLPTFNVHGNILSGATLATAPVVIAANQSAKFDILFAAQTGYGNAFCPMSASVLFTPSGAKTGITVPWKIQPYGGTVQALHCGELRVSPIYGP